MTPESVLSSQDVASDELPAGALALDGNAGGGPGAALGIREALERDDGQDSALSAQRLIAVTGIFPTEPPSEIDLAAAAKLPEKLAGRIRRFLRATEPAEMKWREPPEQEKLHAKLTAQLSPLAIGEWFPSNAALAMDYAQAIENARGHIIAKWPIYPDPSLGVRNYELAPDDYGAVWQLTETLDDIETLFDDLDAFMLLPDQVDAVAFCYPALYKMIKDLVTLELARGYIDEPGKPRKHELSVEREDAIRTLMQLEPQAVLAIDQTPQGQQQQQQPRKDTAIQNEEQLKDLRTPSEHVSAQRAG